MLLRTTLALAVLLAAAGPSSAQDEAELKNRILEKVKARLAEERARILKRVSQIVDEEFAKEPRQDPAPVPPGPGPDPGPKPPEDPVAKTPEKRLRDLDRKIRQLQDQIDDLNRDKRNVQREVAEAKIIEDAKKNPPEDVQAESVEFKKYYDALVAKDYATSVPGFKRLYYAGGPNRAVAAYNVACAYSLQGEKETAIDWLELSIGAGYNDARAFAHMREDTDLDNIRRERRFLRLTVDK